MLRSTDPLKVGVYMPAMKVAGQVVEPGDTYLDDAGKSVLVTGVREDVAGHGRVHTYSVYGHEIWYLNDIGYALAEAFWMRILL